MAKAATGSKKKAVKKTASKKAVSKKTSAARTPAERTAAKESAEAAAQSSTAQAASATDNAQLPITRGKVGVFGGPRDRGYKPDDKLGLPTGPHFVYERAHSLNPKSFYCAMRWDYRLQNMSPEMGKRWWANKKLVVTNPKNGNSVIVRAVEYGPHESTGLDISISPGAAEALAVEIGDEVEISFADQKSAAGPAQSE